MQLPRYGPCEKALEAAAYWGNFHKVMKKKMQATGKTPKQFTQEEKEEVFEDFEEKDKILQAQEDKNKRFREEAWRKFNRRYATEGEEEVVEKEFTPSTPEEALELLMMKRTMIFRYIDQYEC